MTDLSRLITDLCVGLQDPETGSLSGFPETVSGDDFLQPIDKNKCFRSFQCFRSENSVPDVNELGCAENFGFSAGASRATSSYAGKPERPETPETDSYPPLAEPPFLFPVKEREPERPETEGFVAGVFHLPSDPFPISPADVRAGIERELRALAVLGRAGPDAERDAIEITQAKIRNSPALIERQPANGRCHVCQELLDGSRPEIAILQPKPGEALHMHADCHNEHSRRRSDLVGRIMAAAGFTEFSEAVTRGIAVPCEGFASWCAPAREGESQ